MRKAVFLKKFPFLCKETNPSRIWSMLKLISLNQHSTESLELTSKIKTNRIKQNANKNKQIDYIKEK